MTPVTPDKLDHQEREKIIEFLKRNPVGVLATVDEHGDPNASPIYFSVDDKFQVSFTTKRDTRKHANIERHNKVMLVSYAAIDQTSVQMSGKAEEVKDEQEALDIYNGTVQAASQTSDDNLPPVAKYSGGPYVAYRINIDNIWMMSYGGGDNFAKVMQQATREHSTGDPS